MNTLRYAIGIIVFGCAVVYYAVSFSLPAAHPMNGPPLDTTKSITHINRQRLCPVLIGLGAQHATLKISNCNDVLECRIMTVNMRRPNKGLRYGKSGVDGSGHRQNDQIMAQIPNYIMFRRVLLPHCEIISR